MRLTLALLAAPLLIAGSVHAADLKSGKTAAPPAPELLDVPGGDIFGFTSGTDVGKVGDQGLGLENDGAWGVRNGRWRNFSQKLEFSKTLVEDWSFAASLFGNWTSLKNSSDFDNHTGYSFDGMSVEARHRFIERSATNPFALTLAIEPRWSRVDGYSGRNATAYGVEFKAQVDAPINEKLFWAANANFATGRGRDPADGAWSNASDSSLSTALAYALIDDKLFAGAELRWQQSWSKGFFGAQNGQALYFGPTIAYKASESVMINAVVLPQIAGKERGVSGPFDLGNFERANYRLKVSIGF